MRRLIFVQTLVAALAAASCTVQDGQKPEAESLRQYVEPRIGTAHCRWFHFAPGALPFGMAKPAPSTNGSLGNASGWEATGYDYRDTSIEGFPCLHEFQVGGIVLMPVSGTLVTVPGSPSDTVKAGYRSRFDHKDEVAEPGYYSVLLADYGIRAELTATERVAFQRFSFPQGKEAHILFDIGNRQGESGAVKDAAVSYKGNRRVEGWVVTEPEYVKKYNPGETVTLYFSAELDREPDAVGAFNHAERHPGAEEATGDGAGSTFLSTWLKPGR